MFREEKGLESKRLLEKIFHESDIGMAFITTEGKFAYANQKLCNILKYTEYELEDKTFESITHPQDIGTDLHLLKQVIDREIDCYEMIKRYITKTGKVVWAKLIVKGIPDKDGNKILMFFSQIKHFDDDVDAASSIIDALDTQVKGIDEKMNNLIHTVSAFIEDGGVPKSQIEKTWTQVIMKEWKWIITASVALIGGIIAFEVNRREVEFKAEQRFTRNEGNIQGITDGLEELKELLAEMKKEEEANKND